MAPADVAALVAQVAKALGKAHQVGVIHRDIKPDNIFLCDADGGELFVKLLDFGIAKRDQYLIAGSGTTTGAVVGTPYYMSPEQIVGDKDIDARTDIWSLGVVAFEAMTGKRPFEGTTVGAITLAIHTGTRRITDHLPDAPVALDEWFAKACARDPKERFPTPREASQALLVAAGGHAASVGLLRAPMPSMIGDGSDPSIVSSPTSSDAPSDGRAATNLSSVFPVPRPKRTRPALLLGAIAAVVVVVAAMFIVPALLRPSDGSGKGAATTTPPASAAPLPSASASPAPTETASTTPFATPSPSTSASESAVRPSGVVPSRTGSAGGTTARPPTTRPTTTAKPPKPGRTRDDDDIK
jgi:serine/threonine-protein kinase